MSIDDAIAKAVEGQAKEAPEQSGQATEETEKAPSNDGTEQSQAQDETQKSAEKKTTWEYKGDVNALPSEMQEYGKGVQRYMTRLQQEAAEAKKKTQEFEQRFTPDVVSKFEAWQKQQSGQPQQQESDFWTPAEWEDAQLDLSGAKAKALVNRMVQSEIQKAVQQFSPVVQQLNQKQAVVEWEQRISDFAVAHPEFVELHNAGIMKPVLTNILQQGGTLEQAFEEAKKVSEYFDQKALQKSQGRIIEKKNGASADKTPQQKPDTVWVNNRDEALETLIGNAIDGKPAGRVKIRPNKK